MAKCKDCIHFPICKPHTDPNETYPEVGGCTAFKSIHVFAEVVRCKDCKYYENKNINLLPHCILCGITNAEDDFCSCGERREGE